MTITTPASLGAQWKAARERAAWAPLPDRELLNVAGPLRQKFLHNVLSNDVAGRQPGQGCRAALMDERGRLLAFLRVLVARDVVVLEVPAGRLSVVEERLAFYRVAAPVRFERSAGRVIALLGPAAAEVLRSAGVAQADLGPEDHVETAIGGQAVRVARAGDLPLGGYVLHAPGGAAEAVARALAGADALDPETLDVLRVEEGRPWYGRDVSEENLLHETGLLLEYHSLSKGCYIGQEVVARLEGRGGHVNKALRGLRLSAPAVSGAPVRGDGHEIGRVTTAVVSPALGPIALAYVHRSHFHPGTAVEVAGEKATVEALPFAGVTSAGGGRAR